MGGRGGRYGGAGAALLVRAYQPKLSLIDGSYRMPAKRFGIQAAPGTRMTITERAYTSPIWYTSN